MKLAIGIGVVVIIGGYVALKLWASGAVTRNLIVGDDRDE